MIDRFEDEGIGALFVHEWLHGLTGFLYSKGLNTNIHPDNSKKFGFDKPTYLNYYRSILQNELKLEGVHFPGITNFMLDEYIKREIT